MTARATLRAATGEAHRRIDDLASRFDLGKGRDYAAFLSAQAAAVIAVEAALDAAGAERVLPDWPERRRAEALRLDLADLGTAETTTPLPLCLSGEAAVLGAVYVLEGSRLGGALLSRSVPADLPRRFLSPGNPAAWRAFTQLLDQRLSSLDRLDAAVVAALTVFEIFETSFRNLPGAARFDD